MKYRDKCDLVITALAFIWFDIYISRRITDKMDQSTNIELQTIYLNVTKTLVYSAVPLKRGQLACLLRRDMGVFCALNF